MLKDFKEIENKIQERLLVISLNELKDKCKKVMELKEEVTALLEGLWMPDKEAKSVLDWINSLHDVQLNEQKKQTIRERMRDRLEQKKKSLSNTNTSYLSTSSVTANWVYRSPAYKVDPYITLTGHNINDLTWEGGNSLWNVKLLNTTNWINVWEDSRSEI